MWILSNILKIKPKSLMIFTNTSWTDWRTDWLWFILHDQEKITDLVFCHSSPCLNFGECREELLGFSCTCPTGCSFVKSGDTWKQSNLIVCACLFYCLLFLIPCANPHKVFIINLGKFIDMSANNCNFSLHIGVRTMRPVSSDHRFVTELCGKKRLRNIL